jgi:hypothetical protein
LNTAHWGEQLSLHKTVQPQPAADDPQLYPIRAAVHGPKSIVVVVNVLDDVVDVVVVVVVVVVVGCFGSSTMCSVADAEFTVTANSLVILRSNASPF